ncbi:hypothetical protein Z045_25760 [Rhodococcus pyridinivorans KG-16]|uniref:Thioesterase domain-containing protein n=1 Tax=Rhodococcus pyridinivorans KG-16 TaxID=1441730 RepID=A0A0V9UDH5_9NOCA|nr:hypothetical protein Z045_25760 [Rhodococcus pyridinivorans KG-16]
MCMVISSELAANPPVGQEWSEWQKWTEDMPISKLLGIKCIEIDTGRAVAVLDSSPWPTNPNGAVHGGVVAACADHMFGVVTVSALPKGFLPATVTLSAEYMRPAFAPLTFEAVVDQIGRTTAFVTVTVRSSSGHVCTRVSGTMSVGGANARITA